MSNIIALFAFAIGLPMVFIGWVWAVTVSKKVSTRWMLLNLLVIPVPMFVLIHWQKAKKPFWVIAAGCILVFITLLLVPEQ